MEIISQYSPWLILVCIALGVLYSLLLYYKNRKNLYSNVVKWILAILRMLCVSILAFLLLKPMVKHLVDDVEKPIIVLAHDNSSSIIISKDSTYYKTEYLDNYNQFVIDLQKDYEVKEFTFGDKISDTTKIDFSEHLTDFSTFLDDFYLRVPNRNVGALVVFSDGLYNKGQNPSFLVDNFDFPVYTVALGDTSVKKDLLIKSTQANSIAFLGNKYPVEISINADLLKGESFIINISQSGKTVYSESVNIDKEKFFIKKNIMLEAEIIGLQAVNISISDLDNEFTYKNNTKTVYVDVLDGRQKILILSAFPHPDITALKTSINTNKNYEASFQLISQFNSNINDYDLVVLYQLPTMKNGINNIMLELEAVSMPVLYILGQNSDINTFNLLDIGLNIKSSGSSSYNEAFAYYNPNFSLFSFNEKNMDIITEYPPLSSPFGTYYLDADASAFLLQKIGQLNSSMPLIYFYENEMGKSGVIVGEGIWRWRINEYFENKNQEVFDKIISKTVQYLSVKSDKSRFRISSDNSFYENQNIVFQAEVFNDSYELDNKSEVKMSVYDLDDKEYKYTFSRDNNAYVLNVGEYKIGNYRWLATTEFANKKYSKSGVFTVKELNIESLQTQANHQLLYNISKNTGAKTFDPRQLSDLQNEIKNREDIANINYSYTKFADLIDIKWVFFLIVLLISVEWFLRKYLEN